jgi:hypothetical protein
MNSLVALQIMIPVEGLGALVTFEGAVILLLLRSWMVPIHRPTQLVLWVLHTHAPNKRHLVSRTVDIRHDWAGHCRETVATIRPGVIALRC